MSDEYGPDFITLTDDDGNSFEMEHLGTLECQGNTYMAFVPADMDEDDEDYGIVILKVTTDQSGEELLSDVSDEDELDAVYDQFMEELFQEDDEDEGEEA